MIVTSRHIAIPDGELKATATRTQGASGQHVNKASTAIHLRLDIQASGLPEYHEERLLTTNHHLISSDGVVITKVQEYRSQGLNREAALARLVAAIKDLATGQKARRPTRPTRTSKERRLASRAQKSGVRATRGKVCSGRE